MAAKRTPVNSELRRAVARLRQEIDVETAVLFGSRATGEAHRDSDFDLAVFSKAVERWTVEDKLRLTGMIKEINPLIELHLFSERALREARPTNFAGHILATGVKVA